MKPNDLHPDIAASRDEIQAIRRDLHAHPELCYQEHRTSAIVARCLRQWGIETHEGIGQTGVVGVIHGRTDTRGRSIGLRADMDALPMTEANGFAHASQYPGKMHACGHDGHTAMLLAAAKHLSSHRDFDGQIVLIFQPAEEGGAGAKAMIKDGLWDRFPMEIIYGMHNWPGMAAGDVAVCEGGCFASSNEFELTIHGKGGHAALPHLSADPITAACQWVLAVQQLVSRERRPLDPGVISVTMIHGGEATNVIPDQVVLQGTVRTFSLELLDLFERRMKELSEHLCQALGTRANLEFQRNYPPTLNHKPAVDFLRQSLTSTLGADRLHVFEPTMGAEDFSFYLLDKPGAYFLIGNGEGEHRQGGHGLGPCLLHNPSYDFNDDLITPGAQIWRDLALSWLHRP